ncbi:MAG: hypothetical protein HFACDABA_02581 [Anaerolineales bacterium]|nr:hypothetical protein [Anaerolineales bacterium]
MKRITLVILVIAALALTACENPTPAVTASPVVEVPNTEPPAVELTAAQPPVQSAATDTSAAPTGGNEVIITLADNTLESSQTSFQAGVVYTFVITNNGSRKHNFNINPPTSVAGSLDAALAQALLIVTREHLGPGQTYSVDFTFPASAIGQPLELSCLIQRHYDDGMRVNITVTQ